MTRLHFLNAVLFQLGWFACLMGGNRIGVPATLAFMVCHWWWVSRDKHEWCAAMAVALVGIAIDSMLFACNVFSAGEPRNIAPWWLMGLWIMFALTLDHSLAWLTSRRWLAAVLGGVFGPLSYYGGYKLGAVTLGLPLPQVMIIIAITWTLLLPAAMWWMSHWRSYQHT
jgi:Protein of unknown function (DUF2878)